MDLVGRVKAILLTPQSEWPVIEREPGDAAFLFSNYVAILAAIPAVCGFVGTSILGPVPLMTGLIAAILRYVLSFVMVYVVALVIDTLAPRFGAQPNFANALRLTVYSSTAHWLAGIFFLLPGLGFLSILGLYGLYVFWIGLPMLMRAPQDRLPAYAAAIAVCAIVIALVIGLLVGGTFGYGRV